MRMRKNLAARGAGAIVAVTAMAALTLAGSGTANASVPGGVTLRNVNTGRCIDDSFGYGLRSTTSNGWSTQAPMAAISTRTSTRDAASMTAPATGCAPSAATVSPTRTGTCRER